MVPAVFDQTTIDIAAGRAELRATGQVIKFPGFLSVYAETVEDAVNEDETGASLPEVSEGDDDQAARDPARAALHAAAAAVLRGDAGQGAGREGHRTAVDLRGHPVDHPGPRLRREEGSAPSPDRARRDGQRPAREELPGHRQHRLHRPDGRTAGSGGGGRGELGQAAGRLLQAVQGRSRQGQGRDAQPQGGGEADRRGVREVRQADGHQVGPERPLPGLLRLPRVPQHQGVRAQRRRQPDGDAGDAPVGSGLPGVRRRRW